MHSRLYTRVLNKHAWMHNCTAFNSLYNDTGIVGVFASAESAHAEEAVDVLTREMLVRAVCAWPPLCLRVQTGPHAVCVHGAWPMCLLRQRRHVSAEAYISRALSDHA